MNISIRWVQWEEFLKVCGFTRRMIEWGVSFWVMFLALMLELFLLLAPYLGGVLSGVLVVVMLFYIWLAMNYIPDGSPMMGASSKSASWALPANLGGWLIVLLYAPVFGLLWGGACLWRLGKWIIAWVRWLFTEVDLRHLPQRFTAHLAARRAAEEQRNAEGTRRRYLTDVRICEVGLGVARLRTREIVDPEERAAVLERITRAEKLLTNVKESRLKGFEWPTSSPKEPESAAEELERWLRTAAALAEAEDVTRKS